MRAQCHTMCVATLAGAVESSKRTADAERMSQRHLLRNPKADAIGSPVRLGRGLKVLMDQAQELRDPRDRLEPLSLGATLDTSTVGSVLLIRRARCRY